MEGITPQGAGVVFAVASDANWTGMVKVPPETMEGPEKGAFPLNPAGRPRVSTSRQGVTATKVRALVDTAVAENWSSGSGDAVVSLSALGCQYKGLDQLLRGTISRATCAVRAIGRKAARIRNLCEFIALL